MNMCLSAFRAALLLFVFLLGAENIFAQNKIGQWYQNASQNREAIPANLFEPVIRDNQAGEIHYLSLEAGELAALLGNQPALINLSLPYGNKTITLNLAKVNITSPSFLVETDKGREEAPFSIHYRGIVDNDPNTLAAVSFTNGNVMGLFATSEGNFTIGKMQDGSEDFCVYNTSELPALGNFDCAALEPGEGNPMPPQKTTGVGCKVVNIYFECDYKMYQDHGSSAANVTNYVTGLFNQVSTLYANENIDVQISQIFVWTSLDPFASLNSTSNVLNSFRSARGTSFNGNLAHFLTTRSLGGGIAYVNVICNKAYGYGVSMIYNSYNSVPSYSWTVEVVTHELGHNLGSPHTQSCSWVGGALDNCYTTEGGCVPGPAPANGGTIMSYCHLTSYGINFLNGFGTQPGNLIRNYVTNAACLATGGSGAAPTGLSTSSITTSSAVLTWLPVSSASQYTVQYKPATSGTWLNAGTTTTTAMTISGLSAGSNYQWQVKYDCSGYSSPLSFTTLVGAGCNAPTSLVTSNIGQNSATLNWAATAGAANYTVEYQPAGSFNWTALAPVSGTSVSVTGLSASTIYNWRVKADCSPFTPAISFTTLSAPVPSGCATPSNLNEINISTTSATLTWGAVSGAVSYQIKFHKLGQNKWTNYNNVTGTSKLVTGLQPGTAYEWKISAKCGGNNNSGTSGVSGFTTLANSVAGNESDEIRLYPNPAIDQLNIAVSNWENGQKGTGEILNVQGARLVTFTLNPGLNTVDLSSLANGVYMVQIRKEGRQTTTYKFMKSSK